MVIIEVSVYVYIASMMVVCLNAMHKVGLTKRSDVTYFCVLLSLIMAQILIITVQIFIPISPQIRDSTPPITPICLGTLFALVLIYFITQITESSVETQKDARVWIEGAMFLALVASFCALLMGFPETKTDLYRMPFAVALCIGMKYYPPMLDRLTRVKEAAEKRAVERNVEGHKDAIINLAIESWRFAKIYERVLTRLDTNQTQRYTRQLQQFVKKAEESLEEVGLRIVNVEGYPYDPGMAATPLNIEHFEPEDHLVVDKMLEPIIMEGTVLAKTGTVTLRRVE